MQALQFHAGPRARSRLAERGLRAEDVRIIPAAAGGPKGLILNALDRHLFGPWLGASQQEVHLLGASIGAWRMATACLGDAEAEFERLAQEYAHQDYDHAPGKPPTASSVSKGFAAKLDQVFGGRECEVLSHPRYRLHLFTSRGRHLLGREGRVRTPLGYFGAFATNLVSRKAMGGWLERVVFSDLRSPLPMLLKDYRSRQVELSARNLQQALLASCSIPFWLNAVHDIPGAPKGAYWDGGITDYHLHLNYAQMLGDGLVLYPHFQRSIVPGWLDKALRYRHAPTAFLDNVVVLTPSEDFIRGLPRGKLPDRADFQHYGDDLQGRAVAWLRAVREGERLRDEFAALAERDSIQALPL
ncbi:patatin-like phospholipase family protein [Pelomonas sp. SE-A7]|uniref:patatin-like phospholipase family protein n=1 Tax=Pelomonas sp. SE-A7 TaxID=3054953 RepID=UPI00259D044B|nr:patatin-like phospholipase family protein [Pelomonas sp. SE-A7]MDM4767456.1 patatin-like phospholipase family protein [Pelomonas sp. SE-A7]